MDNFVLLETMPFAFMNKRMNQSSPVTASLTITATFVSGNMMTAVPHQDVSTVELASTVIELC